MKNETDLKLITFTYNTFVKVGSQARSQLFNTHLKQNQTNYKKNF